MSVYEIMALVVTAVGVVSFAVIFTILYKSYAESSIADYRSGGRDIDIIDEAIYNCQPQVKRKKKIIGIIKKVVKYTLLAIIIPMLLLALYSKFTNGVATIGGRGIIVVASGSMSEKNPANDYIISNNLTNQFNTYDVIGLKKKEKNQIQLYDVIAYKNDKGVNIIHRIKGFTPDGRYITRGDSNNRDDEYNPCYEDVLGVYTGSRVPYIGMFVMFIQSYAGIVTIIAIIYCMIMIDSVNDKLQKAQKTRLKTLSTAFDFQSFLDSENLCSEFNETIYFKNIAYTFNEDGFVEKHEISPEEMSEKLQLATIREEKREQEDKKKEKDEEKREDELPDDDNDDYLKNENSSPLDDEDDFLKNEKEDN